MALLPTIPTSFVPHSASSSPRKLRTDLTSAFGVLIYLILAIVFALAIGVFFYGRILASDQAKKDTALKAAESGIDVNTVNTFVRLRDRLSSGQKLLANHVALSGFFTLFGTLVPSTVRFKSLHVLVDDSGTIKIDGTGTAKNFNALAATSASFAHDGHIKDAIFSGININTKDNSVSFALTATVDPKVVAFSP